MLKFIPFGKTFSFLVDLKGIDLITIQGTRARLEPWVDVYAYLQSQSTEVSGSTTIEIWHF